MKKVFSILFSISLFLSCMPTLSAEQKAESESSSPGIQTMRTNFVSLIEKFRESCSQTCDFTQFEQAMQWHCRTLIRVKQDQSCCTDLSVSSAVGHIQFQHSQQLAALTDDNFIKKEQLSAESNKPRYQEALAWVQEQTTEDRLPSPDEITQYGMAQFVDAFSPTAQKTQTIIPKEQWKEKRQAVLDEIAKQFADK